MATFLLVHGAFHGGWCWDRLIPHLQRLGHDVAAPDLKGCGVDKTPHKDVSLEGWAEDIAALAAMVKPPVVLVGHSRGGIVVSRAAELAPERFQTLVYLTALMLPDNAAAYDVARLAEAQGIPHTPMFVPGRSEDGLTTFIPDDPIDKFYLNCSQEDRDWALARLTNEPTEPMRTPLRVSQARWGRIPRIFIETTQDRVLPITSQRAMIGASPPTELISMACEHSPMIDHAGALAHIFSSIASQYAHA
jgi:pimeloyl-ACP methyl ester carboxylesterase